MSDAPGSPGLISVRTEVVQEVLIPGLLEAALAREDAPLGDDVEAALGRAHELAEEAPAERATRVARLGYLGREVELERFAPAGEPSTWLAGRDPLALAAEEPLGKPGPHDERAATWRVPGPGGHVRHFVAMRAAAHAGAPELKRCWVYGFLLRAQS